MTKCIFPGCNKKATLGCHCHLGDGWWCDEHLENHLEAHRLQKEKNIHG